MATLPQLPLARPDDHRILQAREKRQHMRRRILDATMLVFARREEGMPGVEDVVRAADISRGAFYKHFDSLDEAFIAASTEAIDRMITDILPLYDFLKEPWQRFSVGFRLFLIRGWKDPGWAGLVTRMEAWPRESVVAAYLTADLTRAKAQGQFAFEDLAVATQFLLGASAGCINALRRGGPDAEMQIDVAVSMGLRALGCHVDLQQRAVRFSREHVSEWASGDRRAWIPI